MKCPWLHPSQIYRITGSNEREPEVKDSAKSNAPRSDRPSWPVFRSLSGWTIADLPNDLVAGITLCAIAIPEQIATARLGSFAPQIGLFAFIAGSLAFAAFGANR